MISRHQTTHAPLRLEQLISRFERNGERSITLAILRGVRKGISRRMRRTGAEGSLIWRLVRTRAGIVVTAYWHPQPATKIDVAAAVRNERQERQRQFERSGRPNRRRLGAESLDRMGHPG